MNTNNNAKRILCFGDSNTWGYIPNSKHRRYLPSERWTGLLQNKLGNGYEIIEEGLNSRGIIHGDNRRGKEGRGAIEYILPCMDTHDPLDYIIILLGTNELKFELKLSPEQIVENLETLIEKIISKKSQCRDTQPTIILLAPPPVDETTEYSKKGDKYKGAAIKSKVLGGLYRKMADKYGLQFLDLGPIANVGEDGIHMTKDGHRTVAESLFKLFS